jgi:hypothetical protein
MLLTIHCQIKTIPESVPFKIQIGLVESQKLGRDSAYFYCSVKKIKSTAPNIDYPNIHFSSNLTPAAFTPVFSVSELRYLHIKFLGWVTLSPVL